MNRTYYTERLILRATRMQDARSIFEGYASDSEVCRYMSFRPHAAIEDTRAFLDRCKSRWISGQEFSFTIRQQSQPAKLMGMISCELRGPHRVSYGYVLHRPYWGNGYMTEALAKMLTLAFIDPQVYRADAICDVENHASARVMEKCGMQREGLLRRHALLPNISDIPRDMYCYARIRE